MADEITDSELLRRYSAGGVEEAFAALVDRHLPMVYGATVRQLNDPAQAREVAQTVFILLARRAAWLTRHPSLAGWLYRTAIHLARHQARTNQRRRQREQIAAELATTMKADDSILSQITPILDELLLELGAADREALLLRFFAGKTLREVGAALGVREDAAQKRVAKALEALSGRFRRRGFRVAGGAMVVAAGRRQHRRAGHSRQPHDAGRPGRRRRQFPGQPRPARHQAYDDYQTSNRRPVCRDSRGPAGL
jgi:RNA polymerase sigma factor (sigma-70 family)